MIAQFALSPAPVRCSLVLWLLDLTGFWQFVGTRSGHDCVVFAESGLFVDELRRSLLASDLNRLSEGFIELLFRILAGRWFFIAHLCVNHIGSHLRLERRRPCDC